MDYLNVEFRKKIIDEIINTDENKERKRESYERFEILKARQLPILKERIRKEFGSDAVKNSRIISSINLTEKIIDAKSKIYSRAPDREFTGLSKEQTEHVLNLYKYGQANVKFKKCNRIYSLNRQACMQIVPKDGALEFRALYPHHYDVIPQEDNPEKAECYIISSFDKSQARFTGSDSVNQKIAESDDYKAKQRFYWWTELYNFVTDGLGRFINESNEAVDSANDREILNPIQKLNFIDIADDKDFEFFVRYGSSVTDFTIDLSTILSDVAEVNRLQGFSQAIITSKEQPRNVEIGPRNVLWLKVDPNDPDSAKPTFSFASPNPDLAASLELISSYASLFLTSIGQSPALVNAKGEVEKYTSGVDRFLAGIERFEQSQDDIDLFTVAETKAFEIVKAWNNIYSTATKNGFRRELQGVNLPDDSFVTPKFKGPEMVVGEKEKLEIIEKRKSLGLISQIEAIAIDRGMTEEAAKEVAEKLMAQVDEDVRSEANENIKDETAA